jgi:hypothetical protein
VVVDAEELHCVFILRKQKLTVLRVELDLSQRACGCLPVGYCWVRLKLAQIPDINFLIMSCCELMLDYRVPDYLGCRFGHSYTAYLLGWYYISESDAVVLWGCGKQLLHGVLPRNRIHPPKIAER